jgi:hypothetical protein
MGGPAGSLAPRRRASGLLLRQSLRQGLAARCSEAAIPETIGRIAC